MWRFWTGRDVVLYRQPRRERVSTAGISWHALRFTKCMANNMAQRVENQRKSWLSLVAETAGVSGATVARVEICGEKVMGQMEGDWVRAIIQIKDDFGSVVGAVSWDGTAGELADGVTVDVGCDLSAGFGSHVVGWLQKSAAPVDPVLAHCPRDATSRYFDPAQSMKLMLKRRARHDGSVRRATLSRPMIPGVAA